MRIPEWVGEKTKNPRNLSQALGGIISWQCSFAMRICTPAPVHCLHNIKTNICPYVTRMNIGELLSHMLNLTGTNIIPGHKSKYRKFRP